MITHDITIMGLQSVKKDLDNPVSVAIIDDAIEDIKKHGELLKLYRDLRDYAVNGEYVKLHYLDEEIQELECKLMKAGKKDV